MHQDNKLANHGKQVSGESRSHGVSQQAQQHQGTAAAHLGPKGVSGNGVKTNQISSGNHGFKSVSQVVSTAGVMLKNKSKRERSVSADSDVRNIRTSAESDAKGEGIMRSKRRCVLERKQPYSGDEWCSGPETEEDEEKPQIGTHRERALVGPVQGLCELRSTGQISESGRAPALKVEPVQTSQQLVYVFTTSLANSAADAVLKGQSDSILLFHQQNVPRTKLEQGHQAGKKTPNMSEKVRSSSSPPASTPKSQCGTPRPSSAGVLGSSHPTGTPTSSGPSDNEMSQTRPTGACHINTNVTRSEEGRLPASLVRAAGDGETVGAMALPGSTLSPSESPQSAQGLRLCPENLSKEQLEHRERSLQTLRDIERLFLRSGAGPGDVENSSNNPNSSGITERSILEGSDNGKPLSGNCTSNNMLSSSPMGNMKKYEEPLQSVISQTQSLSGPAVIQMEHPNLDHPHHQISSPGVDMGHLLGPEGLTPEQIAWRKLQDEYYQEKRRQQEIQPPVHSQHFRMMSDMGLQGGPMMVRGPPPPYHSKPGEQQWGANNIMGGAIRGNPHLIEIHQEGPRGPRFLGQISRGPPGSGFPGSPGAFPMEGLGHQRPNRPNMAWLDEAPNNIGPGATFPGCYPSGTPQHLQGDTEHLITREEMFRIMEKRQMQGLSRFELERLSKQQQQSSLMSRLMNSPGGPDFPDLAMARGPTSSRGDLLDFPGPQEMLGSPGAGPQIRDLVDSPLVSNVPLNMHQAMNVQQQINLIQKLRGASEGGHLSDIFGPGAVSQMRNSQSNRRGENRLMNPGPDGPFQFLNQSPFSGQVEGPYLQDPEMFEEQGPNQIGGTMRLSHMPINASLRAAEARSRHPSDPALNRLSSPSLPAHRLKSPSLDQDPSPVLPSPSGPGLKSPSHMSSVGHQPPLPPASGAGTPSSTSMKSPQVIGSSNHGLHSPSASPGQLKSPVVGVGSPGWTSPKPALPSPGKVVGNGGSSVEKGQSLPPRSSNSTPISQPGSTNTSVPFTSSPEAPPSQNPLSLIMSQMSKYAMPSSTPLYHEAIKTIATSDDEMMPDRPLLSGVSIGGNIGNSETSHLLDPHNEPQSPLGIVSQGQQQLSHDAPRQMLSSPNQMALSSINSVMIGGGAPDGMGPCNDSPNQMGGFPRIPLQSHGPLHSPVGGMSQNFPQSNDNILPHMIGKGYPHQRHPLPTDSFSSLPMGDGPDLSEVIRPTHTGIPEFDLSRIIPCDKPSSILQYFPKSDSHLNPSRGPPSQQPSSQQLLKQLSSSGPNSSPSSNPHLANLQNMMAEQQLQPQSHSGVRQSLGGSRGMLSSAGINPMCPPGHIMGRTAMSMQQQPHAMMPNNPLHPSSNPYTGMISPQQHSHNPITQHNIMMMQAKQRGMTIPGDPFGPQGALMSPQGAMMGPPQPGVMGPQSIRQRGMSLDSPYGPGGMANMPF